MSDSALGVIAVLVGLLLCLRGAVALRVVIAAWGALVGFNLGIGIVASVGGEGLLATSTSWLLGLLLALAFAVLAYLSYAIAVILALGSFGFLLGGTLMAALGVPWDWAIALGAIVFGVVLAVIAIATNLPMVLLTVISVFSGAALTVGGLMLLFGAVQASDLAVDGVDAWLREEWWWYATYFVLLAVGLVVQLRQGSARGRAREQWHGADPRTA